MVRGGMSGDFHRVLCPGLFQNGYVEYSVLFPDQLRHLFRGDAPNAGAAVGQKIKLKECGALRKRSIPAKRSYIAKKAAR